MPSWNWDEEASGSGVVHQSTTNTDHNDATKLKQGYDYASFSEITPDPATCYPLHEDSTTTAVDVAGTNDGTVNGATVGQTGILGTTAYSFDGTDDNIDLPFTITSSYTLTAWVNPSVLDGTNNQIWTFLDGNKSIALRILSDEFQAVQDATVASWTQTLSTGTWYFVAQRWDGSTVTLYANGSDRASFSTSSLGSAGTDTDSLGGDEVNGNVWEGRIGDARHYSSALSEAQLQTLEDVVRTQGEWIGAGKLL